MKIHVIIPAGGSSNRMNDKGNKLLLSVGGMPVLIKTISVFHALREITKITVAASKQYINEYEQLICRHGFHDKVHVVEGGKTRTESVVNAFSCVEHTTDIVMIHDGARPFVTHQIILENIAGCIKHGASCAGIDIKDTIKKIDHNKMVQQTVDRKEFVLVHTPQSFTYPIAQKMFAYAKEPNVMVTDDASLAEALGYPVVITSSSISNVKITTPDDLKLIKGL